MSELKVKRPLLSPRMRVVLALGVIAILVVLAFFAPSEGESDNVTGDQAVTPTLTITHLVDTLTVNRSALLNGMHITVTKVMEAEKFSDDRKRAGTYTVRVLVQAANDGTAPIGVQYDQLVRLVLPDGTEIVPQLISVKPLALPHTSQDGFFDFPVSSQVPLSSLALRLAGESLPFSATSLSFVQA
jgi:hypothetical protein